MKAVAMAVLLGLTAHAQAFDLQGHRGARGLAPENTLAAFDTALRIGVTTLELDIGMTKVCGNTRFVTRTWVLASLIGPGCGANHAFFHHLM